MIKKTSQAGVTLIDMAIVVGVSALLAISYQLTIARTAKERFGEQIATTTQPYYEALKAYVRKYRTELQAGTPITGVINPYQPTVAELKTVNSLSVTYPDTFGRIGGSPVYRIERLPVGCVGATCDLGYLFTTSLPVKNADGGPAAAVLSYATGKVGGSAGYSAYDSPASITGIGGWTQPNPQGSVAGIFGVYSTWSASGEAAYLVVGDARDPGFTGGATISGGTTSVSQLGVTGSAVFNGPTTVNNSLTVTNALAVGNCFNVDGTTGKAGFNCLDKNSLPAGYAGGVVSIDVVASRNMLVSDNRTGFTGNNTNYALATANDGSGQAALATSGRVSADRIVPRGSYTPGTACAPADEAGTARNALASGTVMCISGSWRAQTTYASAGGPCSPNGSRATSPTGEELMCLGGVYVSNADLFQTGVPGGACSTLNAQGIDVANGFGRLLCRRNLATAGAILSWYRLADVTSQLQYAGSAEVRNGDVLTASSCPVASGQSALQFVQIMPRTETSSDGGFSRVAVPLSATQWQIVMTNGAGQPLTSSSGTAVDVATIYCYYP